MSKIVAHNTLILLIIFAIYLENSSKTTDI